MRSVTEIDTRVIPDEPPMTQRPVKVCMHVLADGRADARVLRAMRSGSALAQSGFATSIVYIEMEGTVPVEEEVDGVSMQRLLVPGWYISRRFEPWFFVVAVKTFILSMAHMLRLRADIYHACELTALPACYIVSRLLRKPLIFEAFDLQIPVPGTEIAFWRRVGTYLYSTLLPRCAGIVVTSPLHGQELRHHYPVSGITLVRNVPKYRAVQKTDRLRQYLGLSPATRIALYQGNIHYDRGLDRLIREASRLEPDIVIVMMGKGIGTSQAELEALIAREGVAGRVKIVPPVPYDELLEWTASADVGLIVHRPDFSLNIQTLLPNKLFEYLMAGVPVLTSELGAVVDIVERYDVGQVVRSVEPGAIAAALNALLADDAALQRMRQNALESAKNELNWEKDSLQLVRLYEDIVGKMKER